MFKVETHTRSWLLVLLLFAVLVWLLKPVLLPFVAGLAIAYFLAPVVSKLEQRGVPRWLGAILVLASFGLIVALLLFLIVPVISAQLGTLITSAPAYLDKLRSHYTLWAQGWLTRLPQDDVERLRNAVGDAAGSAAGWAANLVKNIVTDGFALLDALALAVITPVVAFFALRDWHSLTAVIDSLLPRRYYDVIRTQLTQIDLTLSGFIRGQALVCVALGLIYSIGLTAIGLQSGIAIGVVSGVLSFIPFVGTAFGWISGMVMASVQFDDWTHIILVIAVFAFGHVMESYVLAPRLVGSRVGLHPVWVLFALIAGAKLAGFLGVLIAVPVAAVIGVLVRFFYGEYRRSAIYTDIV